MPDLSLDLSQQIADALAVCNPVQKAKQTRALFAALPPDFALAPRGPFAIADRPGREAHPVLVAPEKVERRRITRGIKGRIALLHALAHIELNAINLSLDIALRYGCGQTDVNSENEIKGESKSESQGGNEHDKAQPLLFPPAFTREWLGVADDEAKHFLLLNDRLHALGGAYGELSAHDGLWESAIATKDDPMARLAVVPMVLEARGLDVTPMMIEKFQAVEDDESVQALEIIYRDEIGHVDVGRRWFETLCDAQALAYEDTWQALVKKYFRGMLKRPFNQPARSAAGMEPPYYEPLADWYEGIV